MDEGQINQTFVLLLTLAERTEQSSKSCAQPLEAPELQRMCWELLLIAAGLQDAPGPAGIAGCLTGASCQSLTGPKPFFC
jgi:hypothetical protein